MIALCEKVKKMRKRVDVAGVGSPPDISLEISTPTVMLLLTAPAPFQCGHSVSFVRAERAGSIVSCCL